MATRILKHPVSGDRLSILVTAEESAGELLRFEYRTRAVIPPPEDHVHARQEERIEVVAGTLCCRVGGLLYVLGEGESMVIPSGMPHAVWNADASGCRSIGEFRPALDTQAILEAYFTATLRRTECPT